MQTVIERVQLIWAQKGKDQHEKVASILSKNPGFFMVKYAVGAINGTRNASSTDLNQKGICDLTFFPLLTWMLNGPSKYLKTF